VRGRFGFQFIDSKDRLKQPLMRKDNALVNAPWIEAMDSAAERLKEIKEKYP